jgi:hypothetical protein
MGKRPRDKSQGSLRGLVPSVVTITERREGNVHPVLTLRVSHTQ